MNFSAIPYKSFIGKTLRLPLKLIPPGLKLPILQGRLRGKKWIVGSSAHGCWLGSYEYKKRRLFERSIGEGSVVFDLGAHVGFYTLLASELVGPKGKVIAFEPLPRNIYYLKEHLKINRCKNVEVFGAAVVERNGIFNFKKEDCHSEGFVSLGGSLKVKGVSLDELFSKDKIPGPDFIKIDIEGGEFPALLGAKLLLSEFHPTIFLASHGLDNHQKCLNFLESLGYKNQIIEISAGEYHKEVISSF